MKRMLPAAMTKLLELQPVRIVAAILLGGVIAFLAIVTLERNYGTNIFLLGSHFTTLFSNLLTIQGSWLRHPRRRSDRPRE